ncbi:hypothetical protein TNCV_4692501 [Trichonephila clavipes]|nr:hypothetical protein TNCV_4692501 [Trichonephila clavipes]
MPDYCQLTGTLPPLLDCVVWRHARTKVCAPMLLFPEKSLVLPTLTIDKISEHSRFLLVFLPNNKMSKKSPFAIHKALLGIGGPTVTSTTQTDENITKIVCPPLKLLKPLISVPKPSVSSSVPYVTKSSTSTQAQLLPSTSFVTVPSSVESQPPIPLMGTGTASNSLSTSAESSSSTVQCLHLYQHMSCSSHF